MNDGYQAGSVAETIRPAMGGSGRFGLTGRGLRRSVGIRDQRGAVAGERKRGIDRAAVRTDRHRPRAVAEQLDRARQSLFFDVDHGDLVGAGDTDVGESAGKYYIHGFPAAGAGRQRHFQIDSVGNDLPWDRDYTDAIGNLVDYPSHIIGQWIN